MPIGSHSTFNFSFYNSVDKSHKISHLIQNLNVSFIKHLDIMCRFFSLFYFKYSIFSNGKNSLRKMKTSVKIHTVYIISFSLQYLK